MRIVGRIGLGLWILAATTQCVSLSKDYVEKRYWALVAERSERLPRPEKGPTLSVRGLRGGACGGLTHLVYRLGDARYETDYYNEFLVAPEVYATQALRRWIGDAGIFSALFEPGALWEADCSLEGTLVVAHGDLRASPRAVLELEVVVVPTGGATSDVLLQERYREAVPIAGRRAEDVVEGLGRALGKALGRLEADLREVLEGWPAAQAHSADGAARGG